MAAILLILFTAILIMLIIMTYRIHAVAKRNMADELQHERTGLIQS